MVIATAHITGGAEATRQSWELVTVGSLAHFSSGQGISVSALHGRSSDHPIPVYGGNGIAGFTDTSSVSSPTVVIGRVGQRCGEVHVTSGPSWITDNALYPIRILRPLDVRFLGLALRAANLNDVKNRNDLPLVTQSILHAVQIPWPSDVNEQRIIANTFQDVDTLVEQLDRLIAKKRDLKQSVMQQLLTGTTRLPGFEGEWEMRTLGELGTTYGGLVGKTKADFGDGPAHYITFMNVMGNVVIDCGSFERVNVTPSEAQNRVMKGDLLLNGSSETPQEIAMCAVLLEDVPNLFLNSFCFGFRFREGAQTDGLFMAYYLRGNVGRELMKSLAQGSTRYNLSKVALLKSLLRLPRLAEQTAIAQLLSDMDTEIAALKARRDKTQTLQQAMMQALLTGRIRLL